MEKSRSDKKLVIALIAVMAAIIAVGIVMVKTGSPVQQQPNPDGAPEQEAGGSRALASDEYKASLEYKNYFDALSGEELDKLIENSADELYQAPDQARKLCDKYSLACSTEIKELSGWADVEKALEERKLADIFSPDMAGALKVSADQYGGGYALNKGNLYLEIEQQSGKGTDLILLELTPEGVFPWQQDFIVEAAGEGSRKTAFSYDARTGDPFSCAIEDWQGSAFGKAGGYYVSVVVSKQSEEGGDDPSNLTRAEMEHYLKQIDFTKFM